MYKINPEICAKLFAEMLDKMLAVWYNRIKEKESKTKGEMKMANVLCKRNKKTGEEYLEMYLYYSTEGAQRVADTLNSGVKPKGFEHLDVDTDNYHYYISQQTEMY